MRRKSLNFFIGFVIGVAVVVVVNVLPIIQGGKLRPPYEGAWFDVAVQAVIIGVLIGLIAVWFSERGKKAD
jgi:membrane associated rhomboid family serine protease